MKKILAIAAGLAVMLTACSFFNNDNSISDKQQSSITEEKVYSCQVTLTGGSGRASVESPAKVVETGDEKTVELIWSSSNYDYMLVNDVRYDNEAAEGEPSVFTIPFDDYDKEFTVIGDTTAMSTPHEIEYGLTVFSPDKETDGDEVLTDSDISESAEAVKVNLGGLKKTGSLDLSYATQFLVDYYVDEDKNNYSFITIGDGDMAQYFLKLPAGGEAPKGISSNVTVLKQVDRTYLVSTSVMDLIISADAQDNVALSGTKEKDWSLKEARKLMQAGKIFYAGKYSAPDYELLLSSGCNLAIENTMIYHSPAVKEKLEELGIPVMVERSSYEPSPLGRLEWIKLYGVLYDKMEEANTVFANQELKAQSVAKNKATGKTVAVFSVSSNGQIVIRKPGDYIATMINMAGGKYVPEKIDKVDDNALSTMKITTEDFFIYAADADFLIYNSTIEGEVESVSELIKKAEILKECKAVKAGQVYCLSKEYFQASSSVADFIVDTNKILNGDNDSLSYLIKLRE